MLKRIDLARAVGFLHDAPFHSRFSFFRLLPSADQLLPFIRLVTFVFRCLGDVLLSLFSFKADFEHAEHIIRAGPVLRSSCPGRARLSGRPRIFYTSLQTPHLFRLVQQARLDSQDFLQ